VNTLFDRAVLTRSGDVEASVGVVSLPIPKECPGLRPDFQNAGAQGVAWWKRHEQARRELFFMVADAGKGLPQTLKLTQKPAAKKEPLKAWSLEARISKEQLEFVPRSFYSIAALRAVPYHETTHVEYEVSVKYKDREIKLQAGATGRDGKTGPYVWQNVCVDDLGGNGVCQFFRVGGVIYNSDTYLWADVYLQLFSNGVASVYWHFFNTKLHIEGYDFQGLPVIRITGAGINGQDKALPADGALHDLGGIKLNFTDAQSMCSGEYPAKLRKVDGGVEYVPFSRTFNPQLPAAPEFEWAPGMGRTVRFQFSLSEAKPAIARYTVPGWMFTQANEPWIGGYLPVLADGAVIAKGVIDHIDAAMTKGRFDAGTAGLGNDGFAGTGLIRNGQLRNDPDLLARGVDYVYYWADIMVDHRDFSVHQWIGGWPWKTCAYSKHRDLLMGYMETGDPYLLESFENCEEQYWMWFRTNWPRNSIGRDGFEVTAWCWHWRFLDTDRARERAREFARMIATVLNTRGVIGGQMGAGPHPGYHSSLYMTGVVMVSILELLDAHLEKGLESDPLVKELVGLFPKLHAHFNRDDVEMFPSNRAKGTKIEFDWKNVNWGNLALRIYPGLGRYLGWTGENLDLGLHRAFYPELTQGAARGKEGRPGDGFVNPLYFDALLLGARVEGDGVRLEPVGKAERWPAKAVVDTPFGELTVVKEAGALVLSSAAKFPVSLVINGKVQTGDSQGRFAL
jgi:hypothetical protein